MYPGRRRVLPTDDERHRLLALDGGGIRGVLSLEVLSQIESTLREIENNPGLVLGDWFDYVAGTSTGAIIAAGLAVGLPVARIQELYDELGPRMFVPSILPVQAWWRYGAGPLARALKTTFGTRTTLADAGRRCQLMLVLRNASTDSPWPLSTNPRARYNQRTRTASNLDLPLWKLVRASTAAPTFFPAEKIRIDGHKFTFEDGGVTSYNNPAFQLFLMATMNAYNLEWQTGADRMLLVSVGTGYRPAANENLKLRHRHLLNLGKAVPAALMASASAQQDTLCRVFGDCVVGAEIDGELGDLHDEQALLANGAMREKLFTYLRYDTELSERALDALGLGHLDAEAVAKLDAVEHASDLRAIGECLARSVDRRHFQTFARREST